MSHGTLLLVVDTTVQCLLDPPVHEVVVVVVSALSSHFQLEQQRAGHERELAQAKREHQWEMERSQMECKQEKVRWERVGGTTYVCVDVRTYICTYVHTMWSGWKWVCGSGWEWVCFGMEMAGLLCISNLEETKPFEAKN